MTFNIYCKTTLTQIPLCNNVIIIFSVLLWEFSNIKYLNGVFATSIYTNSMNRNKTKIVQRPTQIVSAETLSSQKEFEHKFTRSQGRTQQQGLHRRARPATTRLEWRSSLNIRKWLVQRKRLQQAFIQSRTYQLKSLEGAEGHVRLHNMWDILTISPSILQYWQN